MSSAKQQTFSDPHVAPYSEIQAYYSVSFAFLRASVGTPTANLILLFAVGKRFKQPQSSDGA
jgi:hypothetical protein